MCDMKFHDKLKRWREGMGMSQEKLAATLNLKQGAVSDMERGARKPTLSDLKLLHARHGLSLAYLVDDALDDPPPPEFTDDERHVIGVLRDLKISRSEAVHRLGRGAQADPDPGTRDVPPHRQERA
jgi:transcriptional regulator with XRE-family HTH domain